MSVRVPAVGRWLRAESHEVFSVCDEAPGIVDDDILRKAHSENWILITNDKDFGEKIYREKQPHCGVVLLRLQDERAAAKIQAIETLLAGYEDQLANAFTVVTEKQVRFAKFREKTAMDMRTINVNGS